MAGSTPLPPGDDLGDEARARVKTELDPGERLLWVGQPSPRSTPLGCGFLGSLSFTVLLWSIALICCVTVYRNPFANVSLILPLGVGAMVVGFLFTLGQVAHLLDRRGEFLERSRAHFALTDRRAIIWWPVGPGKAVAVLSIRGGEVTRVHRVEFPDGSGDVVFTVANPPTMRDFNRCIGFEGVADVRKAEELARRVLMPPVESPLDS